MDKVREAAKEKEQSAVEALKVLSELRKVRVLSKVREPAKRNLAVRVNRDRCAGRSKSGKQRVKA